MPSDLQQAFQIALDHHQQGRLAQAEASYRQVLARDPNHVEACYNLGIALKESGRPAEAIAAFRKAILLRPEYAEAHNSLAIALQESGHAQEAIFSYHQAIALRSDFAEAYSNLGVALNHVGQADDAIAACRRAIALMPNFSGAYFNLGNALKSRGQLDEAIDAYRRAISLKPNFLEALCNLGVVLCDQGRIDEAVTCYDRAISLKPDCAEAYNNLGSALHYKGCLDQAIAAFGRAISLRPDYPAACGNLLYTLYFHPGYDSKALYQAHHDWARRHADPLAGEIRPHPQDRNPDRPLRIGYISPDFHQHPVSRFLLPILAHHDRQNFQIICYDNGSRPPDEMTDRLRQHPAEWHSIARLDDAQVAEHIRSDRIDLLVDLTLHMGGNRMLVFARKPAPVQVTYLAYAGTSGLSTMDYRLSDPDLDPPGEDESCYSEKTIRLSQGYWCYQPPEEAGPVSAPPALAPGAPGITFGCLNNFCKISPPTLSAWKEILHRTPDSRLVLFSPLGSCQQTTVEALEVEPDRVRFVTFEPLDRYLGRHREIDIALDPFPYNGGTTTCDALWMGVAVVSLRGRTAVGRAGVSLLNHVGLTELIAESPERYVEIAVGLANDLPRLTAIRRTLRDRMRSSPLMDAVGHTRAIESAYRQIWKTWCKGNS